MSLTTEQKEFLRKNLNESQKAKELFPEAFKPESIDLLSANNGLPSFMGGILKRAGLKGDSLEIVNFAAELVGCLPGEGLYIDPEIVPELKGLSNGGHVLYLKRANNEL